MEIFFRIILAHFISDFTLQTNKIARWKRESSWGVLFHSLIFGATGLLLTYPFAGDVWVRIFGIELNGWLCLAILTALHFLEDNWRVWTIVKFSSPDSFGFFLWDQFIHYLMIFIFTPINSANILREKWVIVALIYILATHFTTIFIYYIEKDIMGTAVIRNDHKYYSITERLIIVSLFLLPGYWWLFMIGLWIVKSIWYRIKRIYDFSWIHIVLNYSFAILLGVAGRIVVNL